MIRGRTTERVAQCRGRVAAHLLSEMSDVTATTTGDGSGRAHRLGIPPAPHWWALAGCRGGDPGEWVIRRGDRDQLRALRAMCAACPASGECLADVMSLDSRVRHEGVMRAGISGRGWYAVERLVSELDPSTPHEWSVIAAWCVDGDVGSPRRKQPAAA